MAVGRITPNLFQGKENYIIAIGVDEYEDSYFTELKSCKRDINNFTKVLVDYYQCFKWKNIKKLPDAQATKENILNEIQNFSLREKASEWNLIIYFAGHGDFEKKRKGEGIGYWIPFDAKYGKLQTYVSFEEVKSAISHSDVHHILIICDSCHAGSLFSYYRADNSFVPKNYKIKSRWGLTSGRKERVTDGTMRTPSPFSEVLVQVLKLYSKQNNTLTIKELQVTIERKFEEFFPNETQMPVSYPLEVWDYEHNEGQFVFIPKHDAKIPLEVIEKVIQNEPSKTIIEDNESISDINGIVEQEEPNSIPEMVDKAGDISHNGEVGRIKTQRDWLPDKRVLKIFGILFVLLVFLNLLERSYIYFKDKESERLMVEAYKRTPTSISILKDTINSVQIDSLIDIKPLINKSKKTTHSGKIEKIRPILESDYFKQDTLNTNIVFVGSFVNKENAVNIINELKAIGYEKAEIAMKQNLPYAIVIGGFHSHKNKAKGQVESLRRRGIEAYYAKVDMSEIYRNEK
jgi:Caspase domain